MGCPFVTGLEDARQRAEIHPAQVSRTGGRSPGSARSSQAGIRSSPGALDAQRNEGSDRNRPARATHSTARILSSACSSPYPGAKHRGTRPGRFRPSRVPVRRKGLSSALDRLETQPGLERAPLPSSFDNPARPGVFLMINSLETGGSERQFAELARSLNPAAFDVHLGCLLKRGTFLDGEGMHHFGLGGSLYRWQSIKSRYGMAKFMRAAQVSIAHAFDFYANLMLIP